MTTIRNEEHPDYATGKDLSDLDQEWVIASALEILSSRLAVKGDVMSDVADTKHFLVLKLAELEHEVFSVMFLDTKHRVIEYVEMFRGTIDSASVYPREVLKEALKHNAAAVIFAHNHPSGTPEPSRADETITHRLKEALGLVGIRVLDHMIVGGLETVSFAERGIL